MGRPIKLPKNYGIASGGGQAGTQDPKAMVSTLVALGDYLNSAYTENEKTSFFETTVRPSVEQIGRAHV